MKFSKSKGIKEEMKLILSSCDFGNPTSARFIIDNLCKPISDCKVLYFPNEKVTPEKIKSGKYETRITAFGFQRKNIYVANYFDPSPFLNLDIDMIYKWRKYVRHDEADTRLRIG